MPKYCDYTDKDIIEIVKSSYSIAEVLRKLNLAQAGGNYLTVKIKISKLNLDTSHFKGHAWNKGKFTVPLKSKRNHTHIKKHLISVLGHKCQSCSLETWLKDPIPLELEHVDGNSLNNDLSNLKLLCPNCHAKTITYRRRKSSL